MTTDEKEILDTTTATDTSSLGGPAPADGISKVDSESRAERLDVPFLREVPKKIEKSVLGLLSSDVAHRYRMVAYARDEERRILVAMEDPENFEAINVLRFLSEKEGVETAVFLASESVIDKLLEWYESADEVLRDAISSFKEGKDIGVSVIEEDEEKRTEVARSEQIMQDAPIARLVESIVKHAIDARGSDIHIEPTDDGYRVRFRVDGILHSSLVFPVPIGRAVVARIKILSDMKIDEQRKPQDGRFRVRHSDELVDLRVSTFPVVNGEKVVMRILEKDRDLGDFEEMGLWGRAGDLLLRKIREPYGIILITGPTGSGKSTTLYSFLQVLNQEQRNIVTLEDPVEYSVTGVNQSQVNPEIGYTFASGLRSILRQDPNIIMVGEIRDSETAELAIHSALTGHLVLSTLHTNNALGAMPRLVDMGIEPFLLASSVEAVAAQRLVRRICPKCKAEAEMTPKTRRMLEELVREIDTDELREYGIDPEKGLRLFRGDGCEACGNSGYKGRIAIYEAFEMNDEAKQIVIDERADESGLMAEAKRQGMLSMRQDGILKALRGLTTMTEIERVTGGSIMIDEE